MIVTGFEPFGGFKENPTEKLARWISEECGVESEIVPVTFKGARDAAKRIISRKPDAVVSLGLAYGRNQITVETLGINIMDSKQGDNEGFKPNMEKIFEDGSFAYRSTLPADELVEELKRKGIPALISYHAGTYVCNTLLYSLLYYSHKENLEIPIGFVHFPATAEMVMGKNAPYVELESMKKALKIIVDFTSRLSSP